MTSGNTPELRELLVPFINNPILFVPKKTRITLKIQKTLKTLEKNLKNPLNP